MRLLFITDRGTRVLLGKRGDLRGEIVIRNVETDEANPDRLLAECPACGARLCFDVAEPETVEQLVRADMN